METTTDPDDLRRSPITGLPVVILGKVVTTDDVRSFEDDQ